MLIFSTSATAISVFVINKDGTPFRHSQKNLEKMCHGFESMEACLEENTYNKSEFLENVLLGVDKREPKINLVTEELSKPMYGRYYTLRPSFVITTDYERDQLIILLNQSPDFNYYIHVFDPHFYLGFYNPSLPIIRKVLEPDGTFGRYHDLVVTEVANTFISEIF